MLSCIFVQNNCSVLTCSFFIFSMSFFLLLGTVIPVEDDEAGEIPRAYVVRKDGSDVKEEDILAWVKERVAPHKRLRGGVRFTDSIPKTASGKILRREVVALDKELEGGVTK